jgi:hypothetical protein
MSWQDIASKLSRLESDLWSKASSSDLDRATSRIRQLEQDAQHEKNERYGAEENYRRLLERIDILEAAADKSIP